MTTPNFTLALVANNVGSGAASRGKCLVLDSAETSYITSTLAGRGTKKSSGISLGDAPINSAVLMQTVGDCAADVTGLAAGAAGLLRVGDTGLLERIVTPAATDDVVGYVETNGTAHLFFGGALTPMQLYGSPLTLFASQVRNWSSLYVRPNSYVADVPTTDATPTPLITVSIPIFKLFRLDTIVTAYTTDGAHGGSWKRGATYRRLGGSSASIIGSVDSGTDCETDAGLDVTIDCPTASPRVMVTGLAATLIRWGCELRVQEMVG